MIISKLPNSSKHQYKAEFKNIVDSEVLSSDFSGLRTSAALLTSLASTASTTSTASKAIFHKKKLPGVWIIPDSKKTNKDPF